MGGGGGGFDSKRAGAKGLAFGRGAVFVAVLRGGAKPLLPPFVDVGSWNLAILSCWWFCAALSACAADALLVPQSVARRSDARKAVLPQRLLCQHCYTSATLV